MDIINVCMGMCLSSHKMEIVSSDGHFSGYDVGGWVCSSGRQPDLGRMDRGPKLGRNYFRSLELPRYNPVLSLL